MKKFLTLTIFALFALVALSVNVSAVNVSSEAELVAALAGTDPNLVVTGDFEIATTVRTNTTFTLDLNGHRVIGPDDGSGNWYAFIVESGTFMLIDSSEAKTGELYAKCFGVETKGGTFVMASGKITATKNGDIGCAVVNYGGTVKIAGGTLVGSISAINTQAYFTDATTMITGGTFEVKDGGDAAFVLGGDYTQNDEIVVVTGGTFEGEEALVVRSTPNLTITGGNFSSDVSTYIDSEYEYDEETGDVVCLHNELEKVPEVPATYEREGRKSYYVCVNCGNAYEDAEGTKEITDMLTLIIPKLEQDDTPTTPGEGDEPTPGEGDTPTTGEGDTPTTGEGDTPTTGEGDTPTTGEGDTPTTGEGDTPTTGEGDTPTTGESETPKTEENKPEDKKEEKDETPKTGATSIVAVIAVIALAGLVLVKKEKNMKK